MKWQFIQTKEFTSQIDHIIGTHPESYDHLIQIEELLRWVINLNAEVFEVVPGLKTVRFVRTTGTPPLNVLYRVKDRARGIVELLFIEVSEDD